MMNKFYTVFISIILIQILTPSYAAENANQQSEKWFHGVWLFDNDMTKKMNKDIKAYEIRNIKNQEATTMTLKVSELEVVLTEKSGGFIDSTIIKRNKGVENKDNITFLMNKKKKFTIHRLGGNHIYFKEPNGISVCFQKK